MGATRSDRDDTAYPQTSDCKDTCNIDVCYRAMPVTSLLGGTVATLFGVAPALLIASGIACLVAVLGIWPIAIGPSSIARSSVSE
ncbi:MAG: hypothetical protein GFH27_549379n22 [Chloroflexi bacterium AL-W]|nr:hypothetical protein [Chloroflexi bacterium AL-N1]NOK71146.1 hypothetical protein [Chloroflexi bacterium AL-N10]NOK78612.1 hypothetical protein [Chloroflexi bacterium AL-N5]NOK85908.1 hypothetical protein [Chloroflexi bacterium AL-W]NOK92883.1 hypothetical protein [Chloroflexi bacterium AL-N15]